MKKTRLEVAMSLLKGLAVAVAVTLACMAVVAAMVVYVGISDVWLHALNQLIKLLAVTLGTWVAVGRGGSRGFFTGMTLAMVYMILGYGMYLFLGGGAFNSVGMLGEILIGAAAGGFIGAVLSNLPARRARNLRGA